MCVDDTLPDGAVRIPLYRRDGSIRGYTIIDIIDVDLVKQYRWRIRIGRYVMRTQVIDGRNQAFYLHRELLGLKAGDGLEADHINRNSLDNRRSNLRIVTHAQQMHNLSSHRDAASKHRGVSWSTHYKKWVAQVQVNGKRPYLGRFDTEAEAAEAARLARLKLLDHAVD